VIVWGLVIAVSACAHQDHSGRSNPETAPVVAVDSLIVGLDGVRHIAGVDDRTLNVTEDDRQPRSPNSEPPGPCRIFDPQVAFGDNWTQFRSVAYTGSVYPGLPGVPVPTSVPPDSGAVTSAPPKPLMITQVIGIYPGENAARVVFEQLAPALIKCSELHDKYHNFKVTRDTSSAIALDYAIGLSYIYRVQSSALIQVMVGGFPRGEKIAKTIVQDIVDRAR
jgi:hypothetical protein